MDSYIVLDLETTGLSKTKHRITEIAAVKIKNGKEIDKFHTLINPQCSIPNFISSLTGITNDMVKDAPTIDIIIPQLLNFLENETIIAHNASFDYGFLDHNIKKHTKNNFCCDKLCTRKLANRLLPNLKSKKLSYLCEYFNIQNENAHRAMSDVNVTNQIFSNFLNIMKEMKIEGKENIIKFEKSYRKK